MGYNGEPETETHRKNFEKKWEKFMGRKTVSQLREQEQLIHVDKPQKELNLTP